MKKHYLTLSLAIFAASGTFAADWGLAGSGTESDPYQITTADDFAKIAQNISADNTGAGEYFKLLNDINFGGSEATPVQLPGIGKEAITNITNVAWGFDGTLDGDGHEISGIYHTANTNDRSGQFNALFSSLGESGVVKDLTIGKDNYINSYNYVGTIASISKGAIEGCTNNADVTATNAFASGICAQMIGGKGSITGCTNNGNITSMTYAVGIVAGTQSGAAISSYDYMVKDCVNNGSMTTLNDIGVAGIAGSYSGSLINCTNNGEINGFANAKATAQYAAGIVATVSYPVEVSGCENYGKVIGNKNVAGILAMVMKGDNAPFNLNDCKNFGEISGSGDFVAGILANTQRGSAEDPVVSISNCYNAGEVTSTSESAGNMRGVEAIELGSGNTIKEGLKLYGLDGDTGLSNIVDSVISDENNSLKDGKYIINDEIVISSNGKLYNLQGIEYTK